MSVNDLKIKAEIRGILARHWVDQQQLRFECCKGVVRFRGRLARVGRRGQPSDELSLFETLEHEIKKLSSVKKVYFMGVKLDQAFV